MNERRNTIPIATAIKQTLSAGEQKFVDLAAGVIVNHARSLYEKEASHQVPEDINRQAKQLQHRRAGYADAPLVREKRRRDH